MQIKFRYATFIFILLLLLGCTPTSSDGSLRGQLLLWHTWEEEEAAVLSELIAQFEAQHPDVTILQTVVAPDAFAERLETAVSSGLGPDLLIGNSSDLPQLANAEQIRPLDSELIQSDKFLSTALDTLRYQDAIYGLPLSLRPVALYYNKSMVETPARSVTALLDAATNGQNIAIDTSFDGAFWGIQAFGGQLFDDNGELLINEGGFVNWLSWLAGAQDAPGVILSSDADFLVEQFATRQAAYLTANPLRLAEIQDRLGRDNVGVTPLPAGPVGVAGPLLQAEALYFGRSSSENQQRLALELANFLTTVEQSRTLMRRTGRVPANASVRVSEQAFPAIANFILQARTAVPIQFYDQLPQAQETVERLYSDVLDGGFAPNEAVLAALDTLGSDRTVATPETDIPCEQSGTLQIEHALGTEVESFLESVAIAYEERCPDVEVVFQRVLPEDLIVVFQATSRANSNSQLLLAPDNLLVPLVEGGNIQPITGLTTPETLQRFLPATQLASQFEGELYGLPLTLNLTIFYVNSELVNNPPLSLNNLLAQTAIDQAMGIPLQFENNYWGIGAFGGLVRGQNGRFLPEQPALLGWLNWLTLAQNQLEVTLSANENELVRQFANERLALLVTSSNQLPFLQNALGDKLTVSPLPTGSGGAATPLLQTTQLFFAENNSNSELALAYDFALFITQRSIQQQMLSQTTLLPVNVTVDTEGEPLVAAVLEQAENGIVWPKTAVNNEIFAAGQSLIEQVVVDGEDAEAAVCRFVKQINSLNGFVPDNEINCRELE